MSPSAVGHGDTAVKRNVRIPGYWLVGSGSSPVGGQAKISSKARLEGSYLWKDACWCDSARQFSRPLGSWLLYRLHFINTSKCSVRLQIISKNIVKNRAPGTGENISALETNMRGGLVGMTTPRLQMKRQGFRAVRWQPVTKREHAQGVPRQASGLLCVSLWISNPFRGRGKNTSPVLRHPVLLQEKPRT